MTSARLSLVGSCLLLGACSAVVAPDTSLLGDAGPVMDSGSHGDGSVVGHDGGATDGNVVGHDGGNGDGGGPACPASCDDGIACTTDGCDAASGACTHTPTDSLCGTGMRCAATGCVPLGCTSDASCDDGDPCNGAETCGAGMMCTHGTALDCHDAADCTTDSCVAGTGCVHTPNDAACDDGVNCTADACGASGCTHAADSSMCNGGCRSGATCGAGGCTGGTTMTCGVDGNPCTSDPTMCDAASGTCLHPLHDYDGDGHGIMRAMGTAGSVDCTPLGGDDCDDGNPGVHPGATEACNGRDDNCDGAIDEGCPPPSAPDTCATEQPITLVSGFPPVVSPSTGTVMGDSSALADDYSETGTSCGRTLPGMIGDGGPDGVYYIDVFGVADIAINSHGSSFDTVVAASVGACGNWDTHCNDDTTGGDFTSTVRTFCVGTAGATTRVHILIDGFLAGADGAYTINVTVTPRVGSVACG